MANKTDGITDLTKLLVSASKKFTKKEYNRLSSVIFAMLHGVNYGYDQMDQRFLNDAADVYEVHQDHDEFLEEIDKELDEVEKTLSKFKKKSPKKNKDNVIKFSDFSREDANNDGG
jgi:iron-sulfur cluster repair protein YtfE (RIC family)